ncbi:hypothetical protein D3C87_1512020 [compost metagenome]
MEFVDFVGIRGALHPFHGLQVFGQLLIAGRGADAVLHNKRIQCGGELRRVLPEGKGDVVAGIHLQIFVDADLGEDLFPENRQVAVGHGVLDQVRAGHFQDVVGLEYARRIADDGGLQSPGLQVRVQTLRASVIAAGRVDEEFLARQVIQRFQFGGSRRGDDDLAHARGQGGRKIDQFLALVGDGQIGGDDVALAGQQIRN